MPESRPHPGASACRWPRADEAGRENLIESVAERGAVCALLDEGVEAVVPLRGDESYARHVEPQGAAPGRARTP